MKFIMSVSFSISLWPWAVGSAEASGGLGFRNTNYFADLVSIVSGGTRPKREEGLGRVDDWQVKYCRWKNDVLFVVIYPFQNYIEKFISFSYKR